MDSCSMDCPHGKDSQGESKRDEAHIEELRSSSSHRLARNRNGINQDSDWENEFREACFILSETDQRSVAGHLVNCRVPFNFKVKQPSTSNQNMPDDISPVFDANGSLLHLACITDNPFALAVLLIFGADTRARHTTFRRLAVHEAACWNSANSLQLLLRVSCIKSKFSPHSPKQGASDCYHTRSCFRIINSLRDITNSPNLAMDRNQVSAELGNRVLDTLENDFPLDSALPLRDLPLQLDRYGNTAMHWSAFKNSARCLKLLLDHVSEGSASLYANVKSSQSGWTPLHDAAYSDSSSCIELLLKAGANVDVSANSGATPLCFAAQEDAEAATQILLDNGADAQMRCSGSSFNNFRVTINADNSHRFSGYTPLHYCAHYNASKSARVLLSQENRHDLMNMRDFSQKMPIHVAALRGSSDVLRELLCAGARLVDDEADSRCEIDGMVSLSSTRTGDGRLRTIHGLSIPTSSPPILRTMLPRTPISSAKPWNCVAQKSIDECLKLLDSAEASWSPARHKIFTPEDRECVIVLLKVGKRMEQQRGVFIDFVPLVLSFCGRGWFGSTSDFIDSPVSARALNAEYFPSPLLTSTQDTIDHGISQFRLDGMNGDE